LVCVGHFGRGRGFLREGHLIVALDVCM
jgi:hypothetical protein